MRPILLIAFNFARMQWLTLLIMAVYLVGIAGAFALNQQNQEVLFFLRSQPLYVMFLALMLAVPAIQTDRKSRRLLAVLSKGIHRWQYLGGIICGCAFITSVFSFLVWATTYVLCVRGGEETTGLLLLSFALLVSCVTIASAGLMYSTFLHPLLATGAAAITLALPVLFATRGFDVHLLRPFFPVAWLGEFIVHYEFGNVRGLWAMIDANAILAVFFWIAGAMIFARRDVTISPE